MKSQQKSEGFLYCCFSEGYVDEAMSSIKTLLKHNPGAKVSLVTTSEAKIYLNNKYKNIKIDHIICDSIDNEPNCFFRTKLFEFTPYEKTIALDSDTYILGQISNLFDLLDTFDLVMVPDDATNSARGTILGLKGGYSALGYYNCGFIMYRKSDNTQKLFQAWKKEFLDLEELEGADQGPLLRALVKTDLRFITLPKEYNMRLTKKCVTVVGKVKIIHGRVKNIDRFEKKINNINLVVNGSRVWIPNLQTVLHADSFKWFAKILHLFGAVNAHIGAVGGLGQKKVHVIQKIIFNITNIFKLIISSSSDFFRRNQKIPFGNNYIDSESLRILIPNCNTKTNNMSDEINGTSQNDHEISWARKIIEINEINNFLGCGNGGIEIASFLKDNGKKSKILYYENQKIEVADNGIEKYFPQTSNELFDLVYCGGIPEPTKQSTCLKISKLLSSLCNNYLLLSFILPEEKIKDRKHPRTSINYDYPWVQWIIDEGFYFDPHLTIKLRETASTELFKNTALIFQKYK
jgi:hypothetical protein